MKIKQRANFAVAIRRDDNGQNIEFIKDSVIDVDASTAQRLLDLKIISDGKVTTPTGDLIARGVLCSDFIAVD